MTTEQPSNSEKPFVMITADPRSSNQDFHWCVKHEVYSNDSERVSRLKEPCHPSSVPNFKHKEPSTNLVPAGVTLKVSELVKEIIESFQKLQQSEINNGDQRRARDSNNMDADIIRSLFYWLTTQDIQNTEYGMSSSFLRVSYQLQLLKEKKNNYAAFFSLLCHHAGIPCVIIQGHIKGSKYNTGDKVTRELLSEWNAVLVNGQWQFVDAFWGSQTISEQCQSTWFLFPNPKDFIYSHFSERNRWQLLKKPIEKDKFEKQACLKPRFFEMGLRLVSDSYSDCHVIIEKGESNMIFQIDPDKEEDQEFKCVVSRLEADKSWTEVTLPQKNISLNFVSKVSTEEDRDDDFDDYDEEKQVDLKYNALSVKVRFPKTGTYKLEILGVETKRRNHAWDQHMEKQQLDWVAIYQLQVAWVPDWVVYFPQMPVRGWGRNPYLTKCGLRLHAPISGIQTCFPGLLELKFKILPNAPTKNIKLCSTSKANKAEGQDAADIDNESDEDQESRPETSLNYDDCIVEGNIITLQLNMNVGEHKVTIFAKLNKDEKGEVCNYLITCKEPEKQFTVAEIRETKNKLSYAQEINNFEDLRLTVIEAKKTGIYAHNEVRVHYRLAYNQLKRMQRYKILLKSIQTIDNNVIINIRQYKQPPDIIVTILQATFILLENQDYKWEEIRRRFGQVDVKCNMETLKADELRESQVNAATELTKDISATDMIGRAQDVAPFLRWVEVTILQYAMIKNLRQ